MRLRLPKPCKSEKHSTVREANFSFVINYRLCAAPKNITVPLFPYNEFGLVEDGKHFNLSQQAHY